MIDRKLSVKLHGRGRQLVRERVFGGRIPVTSLKINGNNTAEVERSVIIDKGFMANNNLDAMVSPNDMEAINNHIYKEMEDIISTFIEELINQNDIANEY